MNSTGNSFKKQTDRKNPNLNQILTTNQEEAAAHNFGMPRPATQMAAAWHTWQRGRPEVHQKQQATV